jgi:hypothetical protein
MINLRKVPQRTPIVPCCGFGRLDMVRAGLVGQEYKGAFHGFIGMAWLRDQEYGLRLALAWSK